MLGQDLKNQLEESIIYTDDSVGEDGIKSLVIKFNFDPQSFNKLTNNGFEIDNNWLNTLITKFDKKVDPNKPIQLISRTTKDSVYDAKPVVILLVKYT